MDNKSEGQQLFFRRANLKDQTQLWQSLKEKKIDLCVKAFKNNLFDLSMSKIISQDTAIFHCEEPSFIDFLKIQTKETVFANFANPNGQYFFSATARLNSGSEIELIRTSDLFILQRRESPRMDIPDNMQAQFKITSIDGIAETVYCNILDVSSDGFKIKFLTEPKAPVILDGVLGGDLVFQGHNPFPVKATVRFTLLPEKENAQRMGGMEITEMSKVQEKRFTTFLMNLQEVIYKSKKD